MSKLRDQLNAQVFPVRIPKPIKSVMEYVQVNSYIDNLHYDEQYVVETRIRMSTLMTYELLQDQPQMRERCIEQMKQAIIEEMFGEFKLPLQNLRYAIYKNDQVESLKILDKLMEQMYA